MPSFTPRDPEFVSRVRDSFQRQTVMHTIGAQLTHVGPGEIDIELPFRDDLTQQHGFLHAGIVATVLDSACGYAAFSLMPAEAGVLAIEFKVNLMSPAVGPTLTARGRVERAGRTISVCTGEALVRDGDATKVVARMQGTIMTVLDRHGVNG
ncbi:MAG: PaaI family thioesterase [bacterium]|nr:PaaI family thioesterase [bacterium]